MPGLHLGEGLHVGPQGVRSCTLVFVTMCRCREEWGEGEASAIGGGASSPQHSAAFKANPSYLRGDGRGPWLLVCREVRYRLHDLGYNQLQSAEDY